MDHLFIQSYQFSLPINLSTEVANPLNAFNLFFFFFRHPHFLKSHAWLLRKGMKACSQPARHVLPFSPKVANIGLLELLCSDCYMRVE